MTIILALLSVLLLLVIMKSRGNARRLALDRDRLAAKVLELEKHIKDNKSRW